MLREDARKIYEYAIEQNMPGTATKKALENFTFPAGKLVLVAIGKAAWEMANTAYPVLGDKIDQGIVITKYKYSKGAIGKLEIDEAGHPVADENTFKATARALELVEGLGPDDGVLFLVSGGGSALFEKPKIATARYLEIAEQLLKSGMDIAQMNTVRKHLSCVKGGRFGEACFPARIECIVLSDVIGNRPDVIASGPACPDTSTGEEALQIINAFGISLSGQEKAALNEETPKALENSRITIIGSVDALCDAAGQKAKELGYAVTMGSSSVTDEAKDFGRYLADLAHEKKNVFGKQAYIFGGETVVHVTGKGLGGRNQELALSAAETLADLNHVAVFSVGSDGTDGPTDAAGGYVDENTRDRLLKQGISIEDVIQENDAYHALEKCDGLIMTGPTGTNVNDLMVLLTDYGESYNG